MASSVIIKLAKEGGGDRDQARLIDLAHPIRKGKASDEVFQAAKEGMLLGIRNVRNLLLGGNLEEGVEKKLPIGVGNLETKTPGGEQPNAPAVRWPPHLPRPQRPRHRLPTTLWRLCSSRHLSRAEDAGTAASAATAAPALADTAGTPSRGMPRPWRTFW